MGITHTEYWAWLFGIPVVLAVLFLVYRRVAGTIETWFGEDEYERSWPLLKTGLRAGAVILLTLSMLGPYWGANDDELPLMSRDIYVLLDVSASMDAQDMPGSRLLFAKQRLRKLIAEFRGDNIGLILFADYAYVQCPLTRDHAALLSFLEMAQTTQFAQNGTRFRPALSRAMERFQGQGDDGGIRSRAVVMVSDGEDWGDTYASLIERLKRQRIKVYTVGIGTFAGTSIPNRTQNNRVSGLKKLPDGSVAITRLNDEGLKMVADAFDTNYSSLQDPTDDLGELTVQLKNLSASPVATQLKKVRQNQYQAFLFLAVMMLFASLFLMPIRKI